VNPGPDFDAFVTRDCGRLLTFARLLVGDRGHAEDLVQTALARAAIHWRTARGNPEAYARATLVNLARDRWRRRQARPRETALDDDPATASGPRAGWVADVEQQVVDRALLLQACRRLPTRQRAVLLLRFWEDRSVAETAAVLGCTPGTVKSHTHRALARLREVLAEPQLYRDPSRTVELVEETPC
jgi:RNA polymerase sigma-70 factor (sigma-E family)